MASDTVHVVPALTFDELLTPQELSHPAFLKVDVEGHEVTLLKGATKMSPQHMPHLHDVTWEIKSGNALAVCAALRPFGFTAKPIAVKHRPGR